MRKSDARIGMELVHTKSGKPVGRVVTVGKTIIRTDNRETPIAHWSEVSPAPNHE